MGFKDFIRKEAKTQVKDEKLRTPVVISIGDLLGIDDVEGDLQAEVRVETPTKSLVRSPAYIMQPLELGFHGCSNYRALLEEQNGNRQNPRGELPNFTAAVAEPERIIIKETDVVHVVLGSPSSSPTAIVLGRIQLSAKPIEEPLKVKHLVLEQSDVKNINKGGPGETGSASETVLDSAVAKVKSSII